MKGVKLMFFGIYGENILIEYNVEGDLVVVKWKLVNFYGLVFFGFVMFDNNIYEVIFCGSGYVRVGFI